MRRKSLFSRPVFWIVSPAFFYAAWIVVSLFMLPPVSALENPRSSIVIQVKDWHGNAHPFVLGPRNRNWTPFSSIPSAMKKAVVASEDGNFYSHDGVDYEAIREAIKADIQKGKFVRGGSTITQQVAKNVFLSREKTITRKIREIYLAWRIDQVLSKSRIMELYLNAAELGPMVYGIGHASRYYFGKPASSLSVRESAFLAAMLPGPKVYNPYRKLGRVLARSNRIIKRMYGARMITGGQYREAVAETPNLAGLERKVEKTLAAPPPENPLPPGVSPDNAVLPPVEEENGAPASGPDDGGRAETGEYFDEAAAGSGTDNGAEIN